MLPDHQVCRKRRYRSVMRMCELRDRESIWPVFCQLTRRDDAKNMPPTKSIAHHPSQKRRPCLRTLFSPGLKPNCQIPVSQWPPQLQRRPCGSNETIPGKYCTYCEKYSIITVVANTKGRRLQSVGLSVGLTGGCVKNPRKSDVPFQAAFSIFTAHTLNSGIPDIGSSAALVNILAAAAAK